MDRLVGWALRLLVALNIVALVVSFTESFYGLFQWAEHHGNSGILAAIWPLMIDLMVLAGELAILVAHHRQWKWTSRVWAWAVTVAALAVSVAANTGHEITTDYLTRLTSALPPIALWFISIVGFGVMKRYYANKPSITANPGLKLSADELIELNSHLEEALTPASQPLTETDSPALTESPSQPLSESESPAAENAKAIAESTTAGLTDTLLSLGFKATEKSYTMPPDPRRELTLPEKRTRDMFDVDPDISVEQVRKALGIAWATAKKYLEATKEARGVA